MMISFLIHTVISALAILVSSYLTPGVSVANFWIAIVVAIAIGLINTIIGRLLRSLDMPVRFFSIGLISLITGLIVIIIVDRLISGLYISNWLSALIFSVILGCINGLLGMKK